MIVLTDILPAVTERLVRDYHPLAIVLFGSQARGDARPFSDVDLLVVLPEAEHPWDKKFEIQRALRDVGSGIDITVTSPDEIARRGDMVGTVLRPALREGSLIYAENGDRSLPKAGPVSQEEADKEAALWLIYADDDIAMAELLIREPATPPRGAGFNAQQAAEKALKALYIFLQIQYPFSHDLDSLRNGLPAGWRLKNRFPNLKPLSTWAVAQRYPGGEKGMTREDARRHVRQARALIAAIRAEMEEHGFPT